MVLDDTLRIVREQD